MRLDQLKDKHTDLTHGRLLSLLDYDAESGSFYRKTHGSHGGWKKGDKAGSICERARVRIDGIDYYVSRLVWYYHTGEWPLNFIDHINQNKLDNRIENLRDVTHIENIQNSPRWD